MHRIKKLNKLKQKSYEKIKFCSPARRVHQCGGGKSYAHDIEVANADGVTIYYNFTNDQTELEVTYQENNQWIADYAGKVVIPESVTYEDNTYAVTSIGEYAFEDCRSLTEVTIPGSVISIGHEAFGYCTGLTEVTIPNSVTSIGVNAFYVCSSLTEVTIGNSVTSIGHEAFRECSSLTKVLIPNSVTSIGLNAFMHCRGLTELTIGNSVTSIGYEAFRECSGLTTIYSLNTTPPTAMKYGISAFENSHYTTVDVFVPEEALEAYQSADVWKNFKKLQSFEYSSVKGVSANGEQINSANGQITVTGLTDGTTVAVYDLSGQQVGTATSTGGQATVSTGLTTGTAAIVKMGDNKSVKVAVK